MANKRIDELTSAVPGNVDVVPTSWATTGPAYKSTVASVVAAGLNQPNSATAGAGANLTIKAADGVTSGAGGSIYITPGAQATTGGKGQLILDGGIVLGLVGADNLVMCGGLPATTAAVSNIIIANASATSMTTASENVLIGTVGLTTGTQNVVVGRSAGTGSTSSQNVIIGRASSNQNTTGGGNTAVGWYAQYANTTGTNNVSVGKDAGRTVTTPNSCIYIGSSADGTANSTEEMAIGYACGGEGSYTVAIGNSNTVQQNLRATRYIKTQGSMAFAHADINLTGITNAAAFTGSGYQRITGGTVLNGILPPSGGAHVSGRMMKIVNTTGSAITVNDESTSCTVVANRLKIPSGSSLNLGANHMLQCIYDTVDSRWRVWMTS